ncbi:hypothetical protein [Salinibacter ruber]|uniref:hypothetical protein n=1 Tax=Salinibacter ruber TaxID=146919 RepID=UPI0021686816|nr:hypothetical protein [Salinibacter ruber]MCS4050029.1 hypothetical protein [Salinibacter ruber]
MTLLYRLLAPLLLFSLVLAGCDSGGGVPSDLGESTSISLAETSTTLGEGDGSYSLELTISDPGFKGVPVDMSLNGSQSTATPGEDLLIPADTTLRFPESATSGGSISLDIPVVDDESIEQAETAVFDLSIPDSVDAELGSSQFSLTIENNDFFEVVADANGLEPASGDTDAHCIVQRSSGEIVFFNNSDGGVFSYGEGLNVERSASDLNADIAAESNPIDRCDGVAKDGSDNVYFLFRSSEGSGSTYVYKLPASGSPTVLASETGLGALAHSNGTVYLAGVQFDGAPEDGFYSVDDTGEEQSLSTVATDAALDLGYGMDVDESGTLYAFSGGFGGGNRNLKIVRVTDPSGSATIETFVDPYRSGSPLADNGDNIVDVDVASNGGNEFLVVYNGSFSAENGEQWASIEISDQSISLLFNQSQLAGNTSVSGYTGGFTEPTAVNDDGEVFVASRSAFGASYYIAKVANMLP